MGNLGRALERRLISTSSDWWKSSNREDARWRSHLSSTGDWYTAVRISELGTVSISHEPLEMNFSEQ